MCITVWCVWVARRGLGCAAWFGVFGFRGVGLDVHHGLVGTLVVHPTAACGMAHEVCVRGIF